MGELALAVSLGVPILCGLLIFLGYRIILVRERIHKPAIIELGCAAVLITLWAFVVLVQPMHLWQRILAALSAQYGVLLYYCAIDQILNDKRRSVLKGVFRTRAFAVTTLLVMTVIVLDFYLGEHQPSFVSPDPYARTLTSFTETALSYFGLLYLEALIVRVYAKDLHRHTNLIYTLRRSICILGFLVNILGLLLLEGGLLLSLFVKGSYGLVISSLYLWSLLIMGTLVAGSYVLPNRFFITALRPIYQFLIGRQKQQQELLSYLHQVMIQIVPGIQFDIEGLRDQRVPIEISAAREIIWSHEQRTKPITPQEEAKHLLSLVCKNIPLKKPGIYSPAPVRSHTTLRHNIAVAQHLKRLQSRNNTDHCPPQTAAL